MSQEAPFMPTKPYWVRNDDEIAALRVKVGKLKAKLDGMEASNAPWAERQRVEAELAPVQRELDMAEAQLQRERRRQQGQNAAPESEQSRTARVLNRAAEVLNSWHSGEGSAQRTANAAPSAEEPAFMPTTPYFGGAGRAVGEAAGDDTDASVSV